MSQFKPGLAEIAGGGPSLKFLLVSTTSILSFTVSLIGALATFAPSLAPHAADVSLLTMLGATTFGAWAASISQQPTS